MRSGVQLISRLETICGSAHVLTHPHALETYRSDGLARVRTQPRALLRSIPGLELIEVSTEPDVCCGSAGIYNLIESRAAAGLGARKARHLLDTGAEAIAAGNPGCAAQLDLHLRELGRPLPIHHPVELLWRSISAGASGRAG